MRPSFLLCIYSENDRSLAVPIGFHTIASQKNQVLTAACLLSSNDPR